MVPAFNPLSCPRLAVPGELMQHVAEIESGGNRFAIGVVGGRLERQPKDLGEAVATARMLELGGYDYSLGIAQINRNNLARYGLETFEEAFDGCANIAAGARILAECHERSGGDWGKAFSCYYSGNFTTGYRDGYVQRIFNSLDRPNEASQPITVGSQVTARAASNGPPDPRPGAAGSPAYRVSIRSVAIDTATGALASATAGRKSSSDSLVPDWQPLLASSELDATRSAFVPHVHGPSEPSGTAAEAVVPATSDQAAAPDQETADAAFVF